MADYSLALHNNVIRIADNACIPADPDNKDYAAYLKWVASGGVADPYVAPPPTVPTEATKLGLKRAFAEQGQWDAVSAAIAADPNTKEEWDLAVSIHRDDPLTQGMVAQLGLTPAQVDSLLIRANELTSGA